MKKVDWERSEDKIEMKKTRVKDEIGRDELAAMEKRKREIERQKKKRWGKKEKNRWKK